MQRTPRPSPTHTYRGHFGVVLEVFLNGRTCNLVFMFSKNFREHCTSSWAICGGPGGDSMTSCSEKSHCRRWIEYQLKPCPLSEPEEWHQLRMSRHARVGWFTVVPAAVNNEHGPRA